MNNSEVKTAVLKKEFGKRTTTWCIQYYVGAQIVKVDCGLTLLAAQIRAYNWERTLA